MPHATMPTLRNSSHRSTESLQPLVAFASSQAGLPVAWTLDLEPAGDGETAGIAHPDYTVQIRLGRLVLFPRQTLYVEEVGAFQLADWKEEFVLFLAHELRHLSQYVRAAKCPNPCAAYGDPREAEIDAETFALQVLNRYRAALGRAEIAPICPPRAKNAGCLKKEVQERPAA